RQGVFYDGQVFDADVFLTKFILSAKRSILLIDNYVDITTLEMLAKKGKGASIRIVTSKRGNKLAASDINKFNEQYGDLVVSFSSKFHDRFLIIDDKELFLIGASLKDLGKKCFAFTKLDGSEIAGLKSRI
ncbi:ORF6N domain-containing protein, partial [bacterium]|nr:ORF6N domain-containing protein [bacterium]